MRLLKNRFATHWNWSISITLTCAKQKWIYFIENHWIIATFVGVQVSIFSQNILQATQNSSLWNQEKFPMSLMTYICYSINTKFCLCVYCIQQLCHPVLLSNLAGKWNHSSCIMQLLSCCPKHLCTPLYLCSKITFYIMSRVLQFLTFHKQSFSVADMQILML